MGLSGDIPQVHDNISAQEPLHRVLKRLVASSGHRLHLPRRGQGDSYSQLVPQGPNCEGLEINFVPLVTVSVLFLGCFNHLTKCSVDIKQNPMGAPFQIRSAKVKTGEEVIAEPTGARGDGHICYKSRYVGENIPMSVCSGIMPYRSLVPAYQLGKGCRSGVLPLHRKDPLRGQGGHPGQHR